MALMNLAATRVAVSSPPRGSVSYATTAHCPSTWQRTMIEAVGTFSVLAGIAVIMLLFAAGAARESRGFGRRKGVRGPR